MNIIAITKTNTAWQVNLDQSGVSCYITRDVLVMSGVEENRTPVRKSIHTRLSERSLCLTFP